MSASHRLSKLMQSLLLDRARWSPASIGLEKTQHSTKTDFDILPVFVTMGLITVTAVAVLALNALMANAQAYTCECDGLNQPDWDDCK